MTEFFIENILLIDDNDTDNFIHKRIIELSRFSKNIIVKNSGKSALEFLLSEEIVPNVVFLDINMPIVDGFVFLFEFENFPDTIKDNCKIVILSSSDSDKDISRIVDNEHVFHFLTKPLSQEALEGLKTILVQNKTKNIS